MSTNVERMDDRTFYFYAHPLRRRRFYLALVFATLLFPLIALALVAGTLVLLVPLFALLLWISVRTYYAHLIGNAVLVSPLNYPRIHAITEEMKQRLGYEKRVYVFVYEQSNFNASLSQRFFRRAIFLNSEILENGVSDDEVRWVVGRFVGYLRTRRQAGPLGALIRAAQYLLVFNLFLLPYERAMVYSGDRLALAAIDGKLSSAISALQKLLVGRQLGYSLNPEGIIDQQRQIKGTFFAFLARITSGFPMTTTRYVDLIAFAKAYFPAQYAHFVAANPGLPEDVPQLAAITEPAAVVFDANSRVKSGIPAGWATSGLTLAGLAALLFVAWPRQTSYDPEYSSYPPTAETYPSESQAPATDYSGGPTPAEPPADASLAAEPVDTASTDVATHDAAAGAAATPVDFDPDHPIVFDNYYPEESKARGEQGRCVVQLTVKPDGSISDPSIQTSTGFPTLDDACLASVRGQHLLAATQNGIPIEQTVLMPIDWTLNPQ